MWTPYIAARDTGRSPRPFSIRDGRGVGTEDADVRAASGKTDVDYAIVLLLLAALGHNALLAIANAHVAAMSLTQVALAEFAILAAGAALIIARGLTPLDAPSLFLAVGTLLGTLVLSLVDQAPVAGMMRNVADIAIFTMLGIRCNRATLRACFMLSVALVGAVMIVEVFSIQTYSDLFNPFSYYVNTRGLGENDFDNTGLFGNSLGFEGRFSYGLFSTPRTSSIFLEQTSLANFATFCTIYLISTWSTARRHEKMIGIALILFVLLSNNSRTASTIAVICLIGYFVFPRLPRYGTLILPLLMMGLALAVTHYLGDSKEDDLAGRIGLSIKMLSQTDIEGLLGLRAVSAADMFPDSGYSYTLYAASIFGAIALWLYIALIVPATSSDRKRCSWGIGIFFFLNLLIGGNAVYTVKIAAPLWLLAGYMRRDALFSPDAPQPATRGPDPREMAGQTPSARLHQAVSGLSIQ
jgi:hypothetical protein